MSQRVLFGVLVAGFGCAALNILVTYVPHYGVGYLFTIDAWSWLAFSGGVNTVLFLLLAAAATWVWRMMRRV